MKKKPELLAPVGNIEKLKIAIHYGADAVYLGSDKFSLRIRAGNFSLTEMEYAIHYAHQSKVKVYITVNAFLKNTDIDSIEQYIKTISKLSPDGVIVADPGAISIIKEIEPNLPIHLSTQANTTNWKSCLFWKQQGVSRAGLARELSFSEIKKIIEKINMETELFIHGAMCISYSGRCWMSKYMTGRDANAGDCTQSCRWKYHLVEETRQGEYLYVEEDKKGTYLYNSKDLCIIEHIPQLMELGVSALKIEGRMKSVNYLATVVDIYRTAIDEYWSNPDNYFSNPEWLNELGKVSNRQYTSGFYIEEPSLEAQNTITSNSQRTYDIVALVLESTKDNLTKVFVKNKILKNDGVEVYSKGVNCSQNTIMSITSLDGDQLDVAQPTQEVFLHLTAPVNEYDLIRKNRTQ